MNTPFPATKYPISKPKPRKRRTRDVTMWQCISKGGSFINWPYAKRSDALAVGAWRVIKCTMHGMPVRK